MYNGHDIEIRNNNIHDSLNQGILGSGTRITIDANIIAKNGINPCCFTDTMSDNKLHGIYLTGTEITITNNVIHSNRAFAIQVAAYPYNSANHAGPEYAGASHWLVSNNTIAFNQNRGGITVWQEDAKDDIFQNNIFYDNSTRLGQGDNQGISFDGSGGGHIVHNNLFYSPSGRPALDSEDKGSYTGSDNIESTDPMLVAPKMFDFHLRTGSPAIDKATSTMAPPVDFDGVTRSEGKGPDIGAFERVP